VFPLALDFALQFRLLSRAVSLEGFDVNTAATAVDEVLHERVPFFRRLDGDLVAILCHLGVPFHSVSDIYITDSQRNVNRKSPVDGEAIAVTLIGCSVKLRAETLREQFSHSLLRKTLMLENITIVDADGVFTQVH
jgi:hypothetical protein